MKTILVPLFFCAALKLAPAAPIYSVTDLGAGTAYGVNGSGQAAGWTPDLKAFVSSGAASVDVLGASGIESYAYGVNRFGVAAGTSYVNGAAHGTIWNSGWNGGGNSGGNSGGPVDLGAGTFATGINDSGAVSGGDGHAFVFENGVKRDLAGFNGGWSAAYGINSAGEAVGYGDLGGGTFRAFAWTPQGGMRMLGALGGRNSYATAVNDSGVVAGHSTTAAGYEHAFLWMGGALIDLGTLGGSSSYAAAVNNRGAVTGYSFVAGGAGPHAFAYLDGAMFDLNSLIPANSGWELLNGFAINDAGQIVGTGLYRGQARAFRLDPPVSITASAVPEPGTAALLLTGLALAALRRAVRNL